MKLRIFTAASELPVIGVTKAGQEIRLGGFSGLLYLRREGHRLHFLTHTDRGPNPEPVENRRPFALPDFTPELVHLEVDEESGTYRIVSRTPLKDRQNQALKGLPPSEGKQEKPIDLYGRELPHHPHGIDPESMAPHPEGGFWVGDEYGPSLLRFDMTGIEKERLSPGHGLPMEFANRTLNRGFEGLAQSQGRLYAFLESPLPGERLDGRILEIDLQTKKTRQFIYPFESKKTLKIGDATALADGGFAVIERDEDSGPESQKLLFKISLNDEGQPVTKHLLANLSRIGFPFKKSEGLTFVPDRGFALLHDNDFGIDGPVNFETGRFPTKSETPQLFIESPEDLK